MNVQVSSRLVSVLMTPRGSTVYLARRRSTGSVASTSEDLVNRKVHRLAPNELWVTNITECPTRAGKVFCATVQDAYSRRIVGWSIDTHQDSALDINALDMAIRSWQPHRARSCTPPRSAIHPVGLRDKIRSAGLMPSFGSVGDGLDNAIMESSWSDADLLNRKKWKTRAELADAIFE